MERLTEKRDGQWVIPLRQDGKRRWALTERRGMASSYLYGDYANRLAAYEDTGLEPAEITIGRPTCVFYCNRQCNLNGDFCAEGPGCPFELDGAKARQFLLQITQPNAPLTLEELREMSWEPAWVDGDRETEIGHSGYAIIWYSAVEKYVCIWWPGEDTADIPNLDSYGDTWLAYRRKPEEGAR